VFDVRLHEDQIVHHEGDFFSVSLVNRLDEQLRTARENHEQFAIVSRLIDAVREWGFTDPQLEM
jgi:DNA-directed RNA polymerase specialized sigma54-like protein